MVNGVSSGLEVLSWVLADPGDVVIVPTPTYARYVVEVVICRKVEQDQEDILTLSLGSASSQLNNFGL